MTNPTDAALAQAFREAKDADTKANGRAPLGYLMIEARAHEIAAAPSAVAPAGEECSWSQQDDGYDHISTGCGNEFVLNDASSNAKGDQVFPHCPYCARPAIFYPWTAEDDGDE